MYCYYLGIVPTSHKYLFNEAPLLYTLVRSFKIIQKKIEICSTPTPNPAQVSRQHIYDELYTNQCLSTFLELRKSETNLPCMTLFRWRWWHHLQLLISSTLLELKIDIVDQQFRRSSCCDGIFNFWTEIGSGLDDARPCETVIQLLRGARFWSTTTNLSRCCN